MVVMPAVMASMMVAPAVMMAAMTLPAMMMTVAMTDQRHIRVLRADGRCWIEWSG